MSEAKAGSIRVEEAAEPDVAVEYLDTIFLGDESVRSDEALALVAEFARFDELHCELFANQPAESSGSFTFADLR